MTICDTKNALCSVKYTVNIFMKKELLQRKSYGHRNVKQIHSKSHECIK